MSIAQWFQPSHIAAGFVTVLVGYSSSVAIVFQAALAAGATDAELNSWMWALGVGMMLTCVALSIRYRQPILTAWSTPGAALLATGLAGLDMNHAVGIFLFASALTTISGLTGGFQKIMDWVPRHLAAAMLAGILVNFGMDAFASIQTEWALVSLMLIVFFIARIVMPRYSVPATLAVGIVWVGLHGMLTLSALDWTPASPVLVAPAFSISSLLGTGLPLFLVTMTSQNIPGLAVLRANGYDAPASPLITWTGITGLILAPFGGFAYNLAAITAAICMGDEVDTDPGRRWIAGVWAGLFYLCTGIFGATVVSIFIAFPVELIATIAGLALLSTISQSLATALSQPSGRDAALVAFLTTASGLSIMSIGSAFWGLFFGMIVHGLGRFSEQRAIRQAQQQNPRVQVK